MAEDTKSTEKREKTPKTASVAAPAPRTQLNDEPTTYDSLVNASIPLFGVRGHVVVGAVIFANIDTTQPVVPSVLETAIQQYLNKEAQTDA